MAKRDDILELIKRGGATTQALMEAVEVDAKGLASQLTYLRMTGNFPVKDEDGVYSLSTAEEWEAKKAERKAKGPAKVLTPEERLEKAQKREDKASAAVTKAEKVYEKSASELNRLYLEKAKIELQVASILLAKAQADEPEGDDTLDAGDDNSDESLV